MLRKETTEQGTLELIKILQGDIKLEGFYLAGGTALALQIGHRSSIDIDLFSRFSFNNIALQEHLENLYGFHIDGIDSNTLLGSINEIKIDILTHAYSIIKSPVIDEGIKMLSIEDITAMKLNAISGNGSRVKDFIDLYFLLDYFTINEMLSFYVQKYNQKNTIHVLKSLNYFDDIDLSVWPKMIIENKLSWKTVTHKITKACKLYYKEELLNKK